MGFFVSFNQLPSSPWTGEWRDEGYNFEDLRGELVSRKYSYSWAASRTGER